MTEEQDAGYTRSEQRRLGEFRKIKAALKRGLSVGEVSRELQFSPGYVKNVRDLPDNWKPPPRGKYDRATRAEARRRHAQGDSILTIAKALNLPENTVREWVPLRRSLPSPPRTPDRFTVAIYVCFVMLFTVLFVWTALVYGTQIEHEHEAAAQLNRTRLKENKVTWVAQHAPGAKETCQYVIRIGLALECTLTYDRWPFPRQLVCYEEKCRLSPN